ncbi:Chromo domain [Dillenia turbinata]|uniref:DNA (cytosine-5-)-methyltransferase n=1 Tax=Dillenia turbinata TaxID=194707 RepID=A0AAN8Z5Z2_9MAGN
MAEALPPSPRTTRSASRASSRAMSSSKSVNGELSVRRSPRFSENGGGDAKKANWETKNGSNKKVRASDASCTENEGKKKKSKSTKCFFVGDPVSEEEAMRKWPWRFQEKVQENRMIPGPDDDNEDLLTLNIKCHFFQAKIENQLFRIGDCAYIKGEKRGRNYVGRIVEFFKTTDDEDFFRVQWFYRADDTVMKDEAAFHDEKRLFLSNLMNDNPLDCIVSRVCIVQIPTKVNLKAKNVPPCDFYYDMEYLVDYSTFRTIAVDHFIDTGNMVLNPLEEKLETEVIEPMKEMTFKFYKAELALLDIFSGCGGMSTGLCLGAKLSGINLVTRWALDMNKSACESLKMNHPETQIRNESAEDFLDLLKEWDKLCKKHTLKGVDNKEFNCRATRGSQRNANLKCDYSTPSVDSKEPSHRVTRGSLANANLKCDDNTPSNEFEVESLIDICYGDPRECGKRGLHFQVRWMGYGPSEDTWEPIEGLGNCQDRMRDFVRKGLKAKILPRPGDVDVVCGGPPCQGISGYNRFRFVDSPLDDERNRQIIVFMDIINFLKPKYVLMENVVDILRFAKGSLGRYAISRLVHMNYQARLGIMAAGCYGLPQFRLRNLPQFPLPTHDVVMKYGYPPEFERNVVAYDEGQSRDLEKALVLSDAISDLPPVKNNETRDEMACYNSPETEFQKYIRATPMEMGGPPSKEIVRSKRHILYDHRPLPLNEDDYLRVCRIPKRKGANFRDLPGIIVGADNVVQRDPKTEIQLPSGKPLVPDYAINFFNGKSNRPFARLWWDETIPTVLCTPNAHCQAILHPDQDRILTIRECARLQGFPDYYRFCGHVKDRYCQLGNAVAIPVARALGYALGMAVQKLSGDGPLITLPPKFSHSTTVELQDSSLQFLC